MFSSRRYNVEELGKLLHSVPPLDVLALQEVKKGDGLERLATATGMQHICWQGSVAVLSRTAMHSPVVMRHQYPNTAVSAMILESGQVLPIPPFASASDSPSSQVEIRNERSSPWRRHLCVTVGSGEAEIVIAVAHLDHVAEPTRIQQMKGVLDAVQLATARDVRACLRMCMDLREK